MNINEAYAELGLNEKTTKDELNKVFRKLAAKYHPDVCKDSEGELKFKKINEAKQIIEKDIDAPKFDYAKFKDVYGNKNNPSIRWASINHNIKYSVKEKNIKVNFTFNEAANGCTKTINYDRLEKCNACNFDTTCNKCNNTRTINVNTSKTIKFDGPIFNNDKISIEYLGDYVPLRRFSDNSRDIYTNLSINAEVESSNFVINKVTNDVESNITISLVDALTGCTVEVETMYCNVSVKVPPKIKNGTKMKLSKYGLNRKKDHIITVNVDYPDGDELDSLIGFLKKE
jgi:DnaJ-class molecular chaperone